MFDAASVKASFSQAAMDYDQHARLQQEVRARCVALAKPLWQGSEKILDVGCGTGALQAEVKAAGLRWQLTGLDVAPGMCQQAGKRYGMVINSDAASMPLESASFDGAFSSLMLQWASDPQAIFQEMARVIKPAACAVVATLCEGTLAELKNAFKAVDDAPHISQFLAPSRLKADAKIAGFCLQEAKEETIHRQYPDLMALMRSIQAIGATNKEVARRRGLMTPRQLARLETAYKANASSVLPATWQVFYMVMRKE